MWRRSLGGAARGGERHQPCTGPVARLFVAHKHKLVIVLVSTGAAASARDMRPRAKRACAALAACLLLCTASQCAALALQPGDRMPDGERLPPPPLPPPPSQPLPRLIPFPLWPLQTLRCPPWAATCQCHATAAPTRRCWPWGSTQPTHFPPPCGWHPPRSMHCCCGLRREHTSSSSHTRVSIVWRFARSLHQEDL